MTAMDRRRFLKVGIGAAGAVAVVAVTPKALARGEAEVVEKIEPFVFEGDEWEDATSRGRIFKGPADELQVTFKPEAETGEYMIIRRRYG